MKVGVGISTYNGANRVDELLASLEKHTDPIEGGYEVHVLEDGGREGNYARLKEVCANYGVSVEHHEANLGISATWNHLTKHFNSEYMVLLNDDLVLVDGWLDALVYFAENNKFASAGLPLYAPLKTGKPHSGWKKTKHGWKPFLVMPKDEPLRCPCAPGPCFIFKRVLFDFVGGFDECYLSFYEELDFALRLAKFGYASYILPSPWIYHYWARTFAENPELGCKGRMEMSRARFYDKWRNEHEMIYVNLVRKISQQTLKWLYGDEKRERLEKKFKKPKWLVDVVA